MYRNYMRILFAVLNKSRKQHPKNSHCMVINLQSCKPLKKVEQGRLSTAGEVRTTPFSHDLLLLYFDLRPEQKCHSR